VTKDEKEDLAQRIQTVIEDFFQELEEGKKNDTRAKAISLKGAYIMPIYPIVANATIHPPKQSLAVLPIGTRLELIPEPDNQYDPNAIMVWIDGKEIPESSHNELQNLAHGYGI